MKNNKEDLLKKLEMLATELGDLIEKTKQKDTSNLDDITPNIEDLFKKISGGKTINKTNIEGLLNQDSSVKDLFKFITDGMKKKNAFKAKVAVTIDEEHNGLLIVFKDKPYQEIVEMAEDVTN